MGYGWLNGTIGIVALRASLAAGILWQTFGPAAPFLFGAGLAGLAVSLLLVVACGGKDVQRRPNAA